MLIAVGTIAPCTSSTDAVGSLKTKALFAFDVDAIVCFCTSSSACIMAFLLLFLGICRPDIFGVVNISIKSLKRFYGECSYCNFIVCDCSHRQPDPDEGSGSLTYESSRDTDSDQLSKKKANRVRFMDDPVVTGFRYNFAYAHLKDSSVG